MKKILILGKDGQVGWELERCVGPLGALYSYNRSECDLSQPEILRKIIRATDPDVIVNAAAYTAVDKAESDQEMAAAINHHALETIASEAKQCNALLIHYSTDYVFDGTSSVPYTEVAPTNPLNIYGQTKLLGEQAIQASGCHHLILRTSWVYGIRGKNFLLTMLKLGKERPELRIVNDQVGAPTWSRMIAQATAFLIEKTLHNPSNLNGIYHLTASGQTTWYGFAQAIFTHWQQLTQSPSPQLFPITTTEYPVPAKRPLFSLLANDKLKQTFNVEIPNWETSLIWCLKDLNGRF